MVHLKFIEGFNSNDFQLDIVGECLVQALAEAVSNGFQVSSLSSEKVL